MVALRLVVLAAALPRCFAKVVDFGEAGATPDHSSLATERANGALLNASLASLQPGDTLVIPNATYHVMGGIVGRKLKDVVIQIDGTLKFSTRADDWPRTGDGTDAGVLACTRWDALDNVTFTSSGLGTLDGQGAAWWGFPGVGYLEVGENRPRLFHADGSVLHP